MYKRSFTICAALVITSVSLVPAAAHADSTSPTTYYVANLGCSDTGPGTEAQPFCEVSEAAQVATVPGDTVVIAPGNYGLGTDISASGTAAAPITYKVGPPNLHGSIAYVAGGPTTGYGLDLAGASYVDFEGPLYFWEPASSDQILIHDSSHITIDGGSARFSWTDGTSTVLIDGTSSDVTISREQISDTPGGNAVDVATGGTGIDISTNVISGDADGSAGGNGVSVDGSQNVVVTGNTIVDYCQSGISVQDGTVGTASGTVIENNVIADPYAGSSGSPSCSSTSSTGLSLQSAADAAGTIANYNLVYPNGQSGAVAYSWAGTTYASPAAFYAGTGQGSADLSADPSVGKNGQITSPTSPVISSANSDAPGELPTDVNGAIRTCDPNVTPTGVGQSACYDRGATQYTDTVTSTGSALPPNEVPTGAAVSVNAGSPTSNWPGATFSYRYQFGDGTDVTSSSATASHTYAQTGDYTLVVTATSSYGGSTQLTEQVDVVAPVALTAKLSLAATNGLGIQATPTVTNDWTLTQETVNWGDGSSSPVTAETIYLPHTYAKAGTYTVKFAVADAGGEQTSASYQFTTAGDNYVALGPVRVLDTRKGLGGSASQLVNNGSISLKVAGSNGIPTGVKAVVLNLTALDATGAGYIQADTGTNTGTSNVNYSRGGVFTNSVIAPVAANGTVTLRNFAVNPSVRLDLLADVSGYFAPVTGSGYTPVGPARVMDTRTGLGGYSRALAAHGVDVLDIAGADSGQLPKSGITAVELNLTITGTKGSGYLAVYPDGTATPGTSNVNWSGGTMKATNVIVPVGASGYIDIYNGGLAGSATDVVVDVAGYFSASGAGAYVPLTPRRFLDTRQDEPFGTGLAANTGLPVDLDSDAALGMSPITGVTAVVVNTTVTQTQSSGWLAVLPDGDQPTTSTLNWVGSGATVSNLSVTSPSSDSIEFYNGGGSVSRPVQVLSDVMGYFSTI